MSSYGPDAKTRFGSTQGDSSVNVGIPTPEGAVEPDGAERLTAYVRYGQYDQDGEFDQPRVYFRQAYTPVPRNAGFTSTGLYFVDHGQEDWFHEDTDNRVRTIQDQCESKNRVLYKLIAESDDLQDYPVSALVDQLRTFLTDWISIIDIDWYYSGNRSIHAHTDLYITEEQQEELRDLAKQFNDETDGPTLDTSIYDPKSQFRLVGTEHRTTGFYKVPIDPDYTRADCIKAAQTQPQIESFHDIPTPLQHRDDYDLSLRFGSWSQPPIDRIPGPTDSPTKSSSYVTCLSLSPPLSLINPRIKERSFVPIEFEGWVIPWYLKESNQYSRNTVAIWSKADTEHPFSPYLGAGEGRRRSVSVFRQREQFMITDTDGDETVAYLPVSAYQVVGAGDGRFTRSKSDMLIELSPRDYKKYDFSKGDIVVMIGGWSRNSRFIEITAEEAGEVSDVLGEKGRQAALNMLTELGYDVGSRGRVKGNYESLGGSSGETEAQRIKREIDEGERVPKRKDIVRVSGRLLRRDGWDGAWAWIEEYYGPTFDAESTYEQLKDFVTRWPKSFSHVQVPESVEAAKARHESPGPTASSSGGKSHGMGIADQ